MSNPKRLFHLRTLPRAALAAIAWGASGVALAQAGNPVAGETLYKQNVNLPGSGPTNCQDCHGPAYLFRASPALSGLNEAGLASRIGSAISGNRGNMGIFSFLTAQQRTDIAAYILAAPAPPPPPPPFAPPPGTPAPPPATTPTASPGQVLFNNTQVGTTSATVGVLFTNTGMAVVTFANPPVVSSGIHITDFAMTTPPAGPPACIAGYALGPGLSCSLGAQFSPTGVGERSANWTINFVGSVQPRTLTLQGTGVTSLSPSPAPAPAPSPSPAPAPSASSGGAGAIGGWTLAGVLALLAAGGLRRRSQR